jgi:hypothetical protein
VSVSQSPFTRQLLYRILVPYFKTTQQTVQSLLLEHRERDRQTDRQTEID